MNSIQALLSDNNLGRDMLKDLSQFGELPPEGIVAGGAVAAVILTKAYGGNYPINDIDVFVTSVDEEIEKINKSEKYHPMPSRGQHPDNGLLTSYDHIVYEAQKMERSYRVIASAQNGPINTVKVLLKRKYGNVEDAVTILNGFDLNCCHAAIDIVTEQLVVTNDFEKFLEKKILKVTQPYTPIHTAMRLVKKQKELGCHCDIEHEMKYLSLVPQLMPEFNHRGNSDYARYFGNKYYEIYKKHKHIIDNYFDVYPVNFKPIKAVTVEEELVPVKFMRVENLYGFKPKAKCSSYSLFERCKTVPEIKTMWDLLDGNALKVEKNMLALLGSDNSFNFMLANNEYAQCGWSDCQLERVEDFLERSSIISQIFLDMRLNITEQFNAIKLIKSKSKEYGPYVIAALEKIEHLPEAISEEFIDKTLLDCNSGKTKGALFFRNLSSV